MLDRTCVRSGVSGGGSWPGPLRVGGPGCQHRRAAAFPLVDRAAFAKPAAMTETRPAAARIDAALARIEAAIDARARAADALARRHAALKARMAEAVTALDDVISRGNPG